MRILECLERADGAADGRAPGEAGTLARGDQFIGRENQEPAEAEERHPGNSEELDTQLVTRTTTSRPGSRFVPPAPSLPPDKVGEILARQNQGQNRGNGRPRRTSPNKLRQTQLPLEIISKGRFDKSEPTIHHGEDLDVPTYIRRGVALN